MANDSIDPSITARTDIPWQRPESIPEQTRPAGLWTWLVEAGSLTARLRHACGSDKFGVQVLNSGVMELAADEQLWIGQTRAFVREVYLCVGPTRWVHARTIAAADSTPAARLKELGDVPLGDDAFGKASTHRDSLEVARRGGDGAVWGRRSVLWVDNAPFYISEHFINGIPGANRA